MLATVVFALFSPSLGLNLHGAAGENPVIDVGSIMARGYEGPKHPGPMPLKPNQYVISQPASDFGITENNMLLEGATGKEIPIFGEGVTAPGELPGDAGPQYVQRNDPSDPCARGDQAGYSILNVSVPTIVPFVVPMNQSNRKNAAVIVTPGGGARFLSWSVEGTHVAKWLNSIGFSAFVLKHRVPVNSAGTHVKELIDAQRAVSFVKTHAQEYGLNSSRIGFMGFSNGGFLTGEVCQTWSRKYDPIDKVDEASHFPDFALILYGYGDSAGDGLALAPPTFIAISEDDPCVAPDQAIAYYGRLQQERGIPGNEKLHELHVYSEGRHGFGDCSLYMDGNMWQPACAWTLNAQAFLERLGGDQKNLNHKPMIAPQL